MVRDRTEGRAARDRTEGRAVRDRAVRDRTRMEDRTEGIVVREVDRVEGR